MREDISTTPSNSTATLTPTTNLTNEQIVEMCKAAIDLAKSDNLWLHLIPPASMKHYDVVAALKATPTMPAEFKHMSLLSGWKEDE